MARVGSRGGLRDLKAPAHAVLLESNLARWAGERIARSGRRDALLGRVERLHLDLDGSSLEARVRGNRPLPYGVRVSVAGAAPASRCTCSSESPAPCRHAVAALEALRFPLSRLAGARARHRARSPRRRGSPGRGRVVQHAPAPPGFVLLGEVERTWTREERVAAAREEERAACRQRARRERARVRLLDRADWPARLEVTPAGAGASFVVTARDGRGARASCTCPDFAANELATCSHVERARAWLARRPKRERPAMPERALSVWWSPREWPGGSPEPLSEIRLDFADGRPQGALARHFDAQGWLLPPVGDGRPSARARLAVRAAGSFARRRAFVFDVDPVVRARIAAAAAEEDLAERRLAAAAPGPRWDELRESLGLRLHPYQAEGALFLARTGRAFLADDMGLGKTVQAIAAALLLRRAVGARRALVVCPASLKHQWSREIERAAGERAQVVSGPRAARLEAYAGWREGFLVLNYELVLRDLDAIRAADADIVVLDEAQRIKNWDTKTARAVKLLPSPHAFVLTGTPLENRLLELHSLAEFLHPRALGPRWRFLPFHAVTEPGGRIVAYEALDVLRSRLGGFFLRRERRAVLHQLPERTDNTFWTGMTPVQRRPYRKHARAAAALLTAGRPLDPREIRALLRALTAMRILCNAWAQYDWTRFESLLRRSPGGRVDVRALHSPKLEEFARVLEDLLDESPEKVVVFSQWERMLRLAHVAVRGVLDRRDLRAEVFHGGLDERSRVAMLDAFRHDPEFRVLFSTDAGGLGLNLQEAASIVVNLEVPWNPAVLEQRVGRVHRIGQRRSVQVLHFVTRDAIEERVRQVVEDKRALFVGLLVEEADQVVFDEASRSSFVDRVRTLIGAGALSRHQSSNSRTSRTP